MRGSFLLTGGVAFAFMNLAKQFPEDTGDRSALLESAAEPLASQWRLRDCSALPWPDAPGQDQSPTHMTNLTT